MILKEKKLHCDNGNTIKHCFYVNNKLYGECKKYSKDGELVLRTFFVKGKSKYLGEHLPHFPFLPLKPRPKRTRFNTLEV